MTIIEELRILVAVVSKSVPLGTALCIESNRIIVHRHWMLIEDLMVES